MAAGDVTVFNKFRETMADGTHDLDTHVLKIGFVNNTLVPVATQATPSWTTYSANETTGAGYTTGGETLTVTWGPDDGTNTDLALTSAVALTQNGSGPTNIYYGIIYNDTAAGDEAIAFLDMGGPISLQDGDITINTGNIFTIA